MIDYGKILNTTVTEIKPSGIRKFFDIAETMEDVISLGVGEPDFQTPWRIRKAGINSLERGKTKYSANKGLNTLRVEISHYLESVNSAQLLQKRKLSEVLIRNEITLLGLIENFSPLKKFVEKNNIGEDVIEQVEIEIKYSGYIERERANADKLKRLEDIKIPANFDFTAITSITIEARQKLSRIHPTTIGQASRIPGVSPADINILLIHFGR